MIGVRPLGGMASLVVAGLGLAVGSAGCGDPSDVGRTVPVVGKVTVNGKPVKAGTVSFRPDKSKGNNSAHEPYGEIDADGNYKLFTGKKEGAPVGSYRVAVFAGEPVEVGNLSGQAKWYANPKFASVDSSGLTIEVVEQPDAGAYDLKLTP
ncbi:MAG TPA: hypothetical protein VKE74_21410 [Gemmataceae bacterium]|nr:hypothetical protein [Gemmataceae bacterium]